jgi:outer membrane receptor for ferrienterochelin and colicin
VKISKDHTPAELLSLNPFLVERITVLRDIASTSVYGMGAAGEVILVLTRRR